VTKRSVLLVPIILFCVQTFLSLSEIRKLLSLEDLAIQLIVGVVLVSLFVWNQILAVQRSFRRFLRFEKTKLRFLDQDAERMISEYKKHDIELRINVMLLERAIVTRQEPTRKNPQGRKTRFFTKRFESAWTSENMKYDGDRDLRLTVNQGVCGEAARTKEVKAADLTVENPASYNLSGSQLEKTKDLRFVISCPIFEVDFDTFRPTKRVIGVVNLDSKSIGSEKILGSGSLMLKETVARIKVLSDLCAQLF